MRHLLALILASAFLSGCVTIPVPIHRFDSPEALGKDEKGRRVEVGVSIGGTNEADISYDASTDLADPNDAFFTQGTFLRGDAAIAVLDKLDLGIRSDDYVSLHAKYQLLGDSGAKSKAGNFALAIVGHIGGGKIEASGSTTGSPARNGNVDINAWYIDGGLVLGYRFAEAFLIYTGGFLSRVGYSGRHEIRLASDNSLFAAADVNGDALQRSVSLGGQLNAGIFVFRLEGAYAHMKSGPADSGRFRVGAQGALNFSL